MILDLDGWKIALAICLDTARPVHAGGAAEAGADIYAVSALYSAGEDHRLALHLGARAMDNRMFSVLANLGGTTESGPSAGGSGFWGPDGRVIRQAAGTGTEVLTATLHHSALDRYALDRYAQERPARSPARQSRRQSRWPAGRGPVGQRTGHRQAGFRVRPRGRV